MRRTTIFGLLTMIAGAAIASTSPAGASSYKVLYSFNGIHNGAFPTASLVRVGGKLYGTTYEGGAKGVGTVFRVSPTAGTEKVLHSFGSGSDGYLPFGGLIDVGGTLFGTTSNGGAFGEGEGTVFSVDPKTGTETVVHSFTGGADGSRPVGLIDVGGTLYGATYSGGGTGGCAGGCGTVFALNPATGALTVVYAFTGGSDGAGPYASLTAVGGTLYGTTIYGGSSNLGTAFAVNPATGGETVLYSFRGTPDGAEPEASLIDVDGVLYGTTYSGGVLNEGTIFSVNQVTGAENVVVSLKNARGRNPAAGLIQVGNVLYGTTKLGGDRACYRAGCGTVFSFNPATGGEKVQYSFQGGTDGNVAAASLLKVGNTLYGTTQYGGTPGRGTVFAFTP